VLPLSIAITVNTGTRIQLQSSATNRFVRVDQTKTNNPLIVDPTLPWTLGSTFMVTITADQKWQLLGMMGQWVSAENGGGGGIYADRTSASGWESFAPKMVNDIQVQLQTLNGQWIGLSSNNSGDALKATATTPSGWETFNVVIVPEIRGANLGSWFVPESWMTDFYSGTGASDLCSLCSQNRNTADSKMQQNLKNWITESDFSWLASQGFNTIRIPIGYWNAISDPYNLYVPINVSVSQATLDNAFQWAKNHNLKVILDLHGAPGSQNGEDHSGCGNGVVGWPTQQNIQYSLQTIDALASRYGTNSQLLGIELLNEPGYSLEQDHHNDLLNYYQQAYTIIRKYSATANVIFNELYGNFYSSWNNQLTEPNYYNVLEDWHLYDCFGDRAHVSTQEHIQAAQSWGPMILQYQNQHPIFVGEWSMGTGDNPGGQGFLDAQETSFANGYGFTFWTLKEADDKASCEWDLYKALGCWKWS